MHDVFILISILRIFSATRQMFNLMCSSLNQTALIKAFHVLTAAVFQEIMVDEPRSTSLNDSTNVVSDSILRMSTLYWLSRS